MSKAAPPRVEAGESPRLLRGRATSSTQVTESTRRALYDAVVEIHFRPTPAEVQNAAEDPDNHWIPDYGPDAAGLQVVHFKGRWFAIWRALEEGEGVPEARRWTVLRIGRGEGGGLEFYEV